MTISQSLSRRTLLRLAGIATGMAVVSALQACAQTQATPTQKAATTGATSAPTKAGAPPAATGRGTPSAGAASTTKPGAAATGTASAQAVDISASYPVSKQVKVTAWFTDRRTINQMTQHVLKSEFQAQHENIAVDLQFVPEPDIPAKLTTSAAAGRAPDLTSIDETFLYGLWAQKLMKPIPADVIDVPKEMGARVSDFYRLPVDDPNGHYYALPNGNMTSAIFYNAELLDQAGHRPEDIPTNWDEFITFADSLTKRNGDEIEQWGFTFMGAAPDLWDGRVYEQGEFLFVNKQKAQINTPVHIDMYTWVVDLFDKHKLESRVAPATPQDRFGQGQAVLMYNWTWVMGFLETQYPKLKWGTAPLPTERGKPPYGRASDDVGFTVTSQATDTDQVNAAWNLLRHLVGPGYQRRYAVLRGVQPSLLSLWSEEQFTESNPKWRAITSQTQPGTYRTDGIWPAEAVPLVWDQPWNLIGMEGQPAEQVLTDYNGRVDDLLRKGDYFLIFGKEGWESHPRWEQER